jgi:hypothetical protein
MEKRMGNGACATEIQNGTISMVLRIRKVATIVTPTALPSFTATEAAASPPSKTSDSHQHIDIPLTLTCALTEDNPKNDISPPLHKKVSPKSVSKVSVGVDTTLMAVHTYTPSDKMCNAPMSEFIEKFCKFRFTVYRNLIEKHGIELARQHDPFGFTTEQETEFTRIANFPDPDFKKFISEVLNGFFSPENESHQILYVIKTANEEKELGDFLSGIKKRTRDIVEGTVHSGSKWKVTALPTITESFTRPPSPSPVSFHSEHTSTLGSNTPTVVSTPTTPSCSIFNQRSCDQFEIMTPVGGLNTHDFNPLGMRSRENMSTRVLDPQMTGNVTLPCNRVPSQTHGCVIESYTGHSVSTSLTFASQPLLAPPILATDITRLFPLINNAQRCKKLEEEGMIKKMAFELERKDLLLLASATGQQALKIENHTSQVTVDNLKQTLALVIDHLKTISSLIVPFHTSNNLEGIRSLAISADALQQAISNPNDFVEVLRKKAVEKQNLISQQNRENQGLVSCELQQQQQQQQQQRQQPQQDQQADHNMRQHQPQQYHQQQQYQQQQQQYQQQQDHQSEHDHVQYHRADHAKNVLDENQLHQEYNTGNQNSHMRQEQEQPSQGPQYPSSLTPSDVHIDTPNFNANVDQNRRHGQDHQNHQTNYQQSPQDSFFHQQPEASPEYTESHSPW